MERIAIFGSSGQLGGALFDAFLHMAKPGERCEVMAPGRNVVDIKDQDEIRRFLVARKPEILINCAAFHDVAACEENRDEATVVNEYAVGWMAELCDERDIEFATISTDYVLNDEGEEKPLNTYGITKLDGERLALSYQNTYVFRTSGLYGPSGYSSKGPHFLERVLRAAETGEAFRAVDDVSFSPSYTRHVAQRIYELTKVGRTGLHNVAGTGSTSWYEFAKYARWYALTSGHLAAMGVLQRASVADFNEPYKRPRHTCLGDGTLPDWQDGVKAYVDAREERKLRTP